MNMQLYGPIMPFYTKRQTTIKKNPTINKPLPRSNILANASWSTLSANWFAQTNQCMPTMLES